MTHNGSEVSSAKKLKPSNLEENTKPGNKNVVLLFPNSSCPPEESVFSIDHILESIFTDLDRKTLLNCRLVSRRWLHFSSASLKKIITFKFVLCYNGWEPGYYKCHDHFISELIPLMNNSNHFPCNSLSFVSYPRLFRKPEKLDQEFFAAHGSFIKKLEFRGDYDLSDVKRLILTQAPNLEELKFNWVRLNKTAIISSKPVFKNLKKLVVLEANSDIPDIFVQQLIECSPNLVEVFVPLEYLHFLVKPVNRLHLIKKLELNIKKENIESLKAVGNSRQDNWAVQEIHFAGTWSDNEIETDFPSSEVAEALIKIFKGCSATCLKLQYNLFTYGYQYHLPTMHRVKDVSFHCHNEIPANTLVEGANLGDTFPNLRSLRISAKYNDIDLNIDNLFGESPVPFPNVRKASYSSRFLSAQNILEGFQKIFPNAVIDTDTESESD